jgi:hypothetical protein
MPDPDKNHFGSATLPQTTKARANVQVLCGNRNRRVAVPILVLVVRVAGVLMRGAHALRAVPEYQKRYYRRNTRYYYYRRKDALLN